MKYKEKLEEAKKLYASANADQKYVLKSLFPELAELKDDETLRKNLIKAFNTVGGRYWGGLEVREILTWLEKKDEFLPEVKESEDDKIRKEIIAYFKADWAEEEGITRPDWIAWLEKQERKDYNPYRVIIESIAEMCERYSHTKDWKDFYDNVKVKCKDAIEYDNKANHEKRGKQKSIIKMKTPEESLGIDSDTYNEIVDACIYDEQKSADNIEPKFKIGDWVVQENIGVYKIIEVCESWYEVVDNKDKHYSIGFDKEYMCHLWNITQDAKDGDVLYAGGSHCYFKEYIFMFSSFTEDNVISTHFGYDVFHGTFDKDITRFGREEDFMFVTPATKKQRELLFQKMKEEGYEWDKKELKKILITPRFEIGDVLCNKSCTTLDKKSQSNFEIIDIRNDMYICDKCSFPIYQQDEYELVAKRIKQNSTWNEEDEKMVKDIIAAIDTLHYHGMVNWLKSLKHRYAWKPSEEQYEALDYAYNSCSDTERGNYYEGVLETLIEDLHKLSETQGEKLQDKTTPDAAKEEKVDNQNCVEPIDKAEPKFHEGEWITNGDYTWKIIEVKPLDYILQSQDGNIVDDTISYVDEQFHSFTIEDAKAGDIVVEDKIPGHPSPFIAIFKEIGTDPDTFNSRCFIDFDGNFNEGDVGHDITNIHPATKKQRDTLVAKMKEAGLTDFEKSLEHIMIETLECGDTRNLKADAEMLLRFIQKPIKWSENDEEYINDLIGVFDGQQHQAHSDEEIVNWLKTLKNKYV